MQESEYRRRRKLFRDLMRREGFHALLVTHLPDVRYLCGFSGSNGTVFLREDRGFFLTDFRYREQSKSEVRGLKVLVYDTDLEEVLLLALHGRDGTRIGFDPAALTYAEVTAMRRWLKGIARLAPIRGSMAALRARKSPAEVQTLRQGVRMAQEAFREALRGSGAWESEEDFALRLDLAGRKKGAEDRSFETIVAGGVRGAVVHAGPTRRRISGATVIDWGVVHRGYHTDTTRTIAFGKVPPALRKAHDLVLEAQERALEAVKPGARARDVDRAAREVIEQAGYGPYFGHGLGHGVGLEVHERPHVSQASGDVLEEGMVLTIEPGIYLPGKGGVRVEDMVLVTARGAEFLTTLPRTLDPSDYV